MTTTLLDQVRVAVEAKPDNVALLQGERSLTYREMWDAAGRLASVLASRLPPPADSPFVAFVGSPTIAAYVHLLAISRSGRAFLPLEPELSPEKLQGLLAQAGATTVLADAASLPLVASICALSPAPLLVLVGDAPASQVAAAIPAPHAVLGSDEPADPEVLAPIAPQAHDPLYLLFTSGSTGTPKGVVIEHGNLATYLGAFDRVVDLGPADVVLQLFRFSFDPSVMMTFTAWRAGAALVLPEADGGVLSEALLINRHGATYWAGVPSRSALMGRLRQLKPGAYPSLRHVVLGAEVLHDDVAQAWSQAAPAARIINAYGPTETTIGALSYVWDPVSSPGEVVDGRVPIGYPLEGVEIMVVDEHLVEVAPGQRGELLIGGPQVGRGYWGDPDRTAAAFITPPGRDSRFYRTGDVVWRATQDGPLHFVGRTDFQVKVRGRRIELGEVETAVRRLFGYDEVVALGWPATTGGFDGVEVFACGDEARVPDRDLLVPVLAPEAVPHRITVLPEMPRTPSGKPDRAALRRMLGELP